MRAWGEAKAHGMLDVEHRIWRAGDASWRWHLTRSLPVREETKPGAHDGPIMEWVGTGTDIHDERMARSDMHTQGAE